MLKITEKEKVEEKEIKTGFNFENCKRNDFLEKSVGMKMPITRKTGTTICGV